MRVPLLALTVLVACAAGPAVAEPSPENMELARRYAAAIHMESQMVAVMNNLMPVMIERVAAERGVQPSPEVSAAATRAAGEAMRIMTPRMLEAMTPAIADVFTTEELKAAVDYYESPRAQSLLGKMPAFMAKVMPAMEPILPQMEKEMAVQICKEIGCDPNDLDR